MPVISSLRRLFLFLLLLYLAATCLQAQNIITVFDKDLKAGNYSWTAGNIYLLQEKIYLETGGRLSIEAGTLIKAAQHGAVAQEDIGLVVLPGAEIRAAGRADAPIIFTADQDDLTGSLSPSNNKGLWSGLVIMGNPGSNSGQLSYVSLRYAGRNLLGKENPALAFWMVDQQTQLDHIEVFASDSDGISFFGGTASLRHAVVSYTTLDAFNWDYGWKGTGIYWLSFLGRFSLDGAGNSLDQRPIYSQPAIYNASFLNSEDGIIFRNNSGGTLANSLIVQTEYDGRINIEDTSGQSDSRGQLVNGNLSFYSNVFSRFPTEDGQIGSILSDPDDSAVVKHFTDQFNILSKRGLRYYGCFKAPIFDPRPDQRGEFETLPNLNYPDVLLPYRPAGSQKGAFVTEEIWLSNWTALDLIGQIGDAAIVKYKFRDLIFQSGDTINLDCQAMAVFQDSVIMLDPCGGTVQPEGIRSSASRRGNRKRPAEKKGGPEIPAFVEEWQVVSSFDRLSSYLRDILEVTINIYDTTAPVIHLIPDGTGRLKPLLEDCDEAWITTENVRPESAAGKSYIRYFYEAEDYSGNRSSLEFSQEVGQAFLQYADLDRDGYGNANMDIRAGNMIPGYVTNGADCNDNHPEVYPNSLAITGLDCNVIPSNDHCKDAVQLPFLDCSSFDSDGYRFPGSSASIYPPTYNECLFLKNYRDLWYRMQVPGLGSIGLKVKNTLPLTFPAGGFNAEWYTGDCRDLEYLDCASGDSLDLAINNLTPGTFLYLRLMESANIGYTEFAICTFQPEPAPGFGGGRPDAVLQAETLNNRSGYIRLFPNPISKLNDLQINLSGMESPPTSIGLFRANGELLFTQAISPNEEPLYLSLRERGLSAGLYFLRLQSPLGPVVKKLIITD